MTEDNPFDPESLSRISMLSPETLQMLHQLASSAEGAILEIGPFIGGSTCAMALAVRDSKLPFISIEVGGESSHPTMATDDILRDLRANLAKRGLLERVTIVPKWAHEAYDRNGIEALLGGEKIGLLFIDSDGAAGFHLFHLGRYLREGSIIALDDIEDPLKGVLVRQYVDAALANRSVTQITLTSGGTWFGRLVKSASQLPRLPFSRENERCWLSYTHLDCPSDNVHDNTRSPVKIYEDNRQLGPAHSIHEEIRKLGGGRFSHWESCLFFSSSDNSDPNENGRSYVARVDDQTIALC